ncbi:HAMP domain-containing hybrid sensor histidine kinase/response regulator [Beggiatoa leptomitoformis]|uniref:histidine kinase n=1 Tax=Beggiatoa leptomitoformis TaxID=288004 RepID=A0A2N9YH50_9GAMM|nr:ATP-binding protein [Beggiatoa leptomitoformis]AUI69793.1 response regulator [Beggiatoa leptomitoformis]QGX03676.1 response regulator [Beggiatoa leptomitoformis]
MLISAINRFAEKVFGRVPLLIMLTIPFILQMIIALILVISLSFIYRGQLAEGFMQRLNEACLLRIEQYLQNYLTLPTQLLDYDVAFLQKESIESEKLTSYFSKQLYSFNAISSIWFASIQGQFVSVVKTHDSLLLISTKSPYHTVLQQSFQNIAGDYSHTEQQDTFSFQHSFWYQLPLMNHWETWSNVTSADLPLLERPQQVLSKPVYDLKGQLIGVLGIGVDTYDISDFLQQTLVSENSHILIFESKGPLLALASRFNQQTVMPPLESLIYSNVFVTSLPQPLQSMMNQLQTYLKSGRTIHELQHLHMSINEKNHLFTIKPFKDKHDLSWFIVVLSPELDFMTAVHKDTLNMVTFALLAVLLFAWFSIRTARWVIKPVLSLDDAAQQLAMGKWAHALPVRRVDEMGSLAVSFNTMARQLQASIATLKIKNDELQQLNQLKEIKFHNMAAMVPGVIFQWYEKNTGQQGFYYVSSRCWDLYGISAEALQAGTQSLPIHPDDDIHWRENVRRAIERGEELSVEGRFVLKNGEVKWWRIIAKPVMSRDEVVLNGIIIDITQQQALEESLRQAKETAEQAKLAADIANHAKSRFLANMSHELRTPMNAILGFAQLMIRDAQVTAVQQENLNIIIESGEHLLELINDVLEMSKIEAGQITLNKTTVDLQQMLNNILKMLRIRAKNKGLLLHDVVHATVPRYVKTDENKLRQILINLIANAIKFTEQGQVTVQVAYQPATANKMAQLHFAVQDTGIGIDPNEIERLFEAFQQSVHHNKPYEGSGLGLPISRQFVQLMGGDIDVQSQLGEGSTFHFTVTIERADINTLPISEPYATVVGLATGQANYKLLIVEDNDESRLLLKRLLEGVGFVVNEASNGKQAVSLCQQWQPDLIWMDIRMPVMNGYEATKQIKAQAKGKNIIIIALTASAFEHERQHILDAGCDDFVRKPFREREIFDKLAYYLGVRFIYNTQTNNSISPAPTEQSTTSFHHLEQRLHTLPAQWLTDLQLAAAQADNDVVMQLLQELPNTHHDIADNIATLAHDFQFDTIITLCKSVLSLSPNRQVQ